MSNGVKRDIPYKEWLKTPEGRERTRGYSRKHYERNRDKMIARSKLQVKDAEANKKYLKLYNKKNRLKYKEYYRKWRAENRDKMRAMQKADRDKHPEKWKARRSVKVALRNGSIKKEPCSICKKVAEAHHSDYSKPLDVTWLCRAHHAAWHRIFSIQGE